MIQNLSLSGHTKYGLCEFVIDSEDDLENLPLDVPMGSTAICIATSAVYMLNSQGEWLEI